MIIHYESKRQTAYRQREVKTTMNALLEYLSLYSPGMVEDDVLVAVKDIVWLVAPLTY